MSASNTDDVIIITIITSNYYYYSFIFAFYYTPYIHRFVIVEFPDFNSQLVTLNIALAIIASGLLGFAVHVSR